MPQFVKVVINDKLRCQGAQQILGAFYAKDLVSAKDISAIEDQESLIFAFSRVDQSTGIDRQIVATLKARQVATVVWDDGTFDERRIALIEDGHGIGATITVTANPLQLDMSDGADSATGKGYVSAMSNCNRVFNFAASGSATTILTTYVIPACPTWITLGTIDPVALIPSISWNRLTPLALILQVRDALRTMNIPCEFRLRRNGTTDYKLDLVTQIGTGATVPLFHPRASLRTLRRRVDTTQQANRLFSVGQNDPTGNPGISGSARWLVTAVDGAAKTLTLADPNSGAGPIAFVNQFCTGSNVWVNRVLTGGSFLITVSDPVTQKVTLPSVSTFAAGEFVTLRYSEPGTNAIVRTTPSPRFAVASVSGAADWITCSTNPITVNNQHVDWYAKIWTASSGGTVRTTVRIGSTDAATDKIFAAGAGGPFSSVLLTDFCEFIQLDGAGEIPAYLENPSALTTYGLKSGNITVGTATGVTQLVPNGWTRAWANPAALPDGWQQIGGAFSQNTNPLFLKYGPTSLHYGGGIIYSPVFYPSLCVGNSRLSFRLQLYFDSFTGGGTSFEFDIGLANPDGTPGGGAPYASVTVLSLNFVTPPPQFKQVPENAWITLELPGLDLSLDKAPYGLVLSGRATGGSFSAYIAAFEAHQFATNPPGTYEFGDATVVHQSTNAQLAANGNPLVAYDAAISDLERFDPVTFAANKMTLGGSVRVFDPDIMVDTTVRLLRIERDLLRPQQSVVGLATLPKLLTQQIPVVTGT